MKSKDITNKEDFQKKQMAQINRALGVFLLFFSAVIIVSVFFTESFVGKMTNLTAGLILCVIGAILFFYTKKSRGVP